MKPFHKIPLEAVILYRNAVELSWRGDHERALGNLNNAVTIAPQFAVALCEMGQCYEKLGRYPEALSAFDTVLRSFPAHTEAKMNRDRIQETMEGKSNHNPDMKKL